MSCFIATPLLYSVGNEPLELCTDVTPPPFGWLRQFLAVPSAQPIRLRRYAHHRTGCFTCSTSRRVAARCRMHPSYCFRGANHYSPMTPPSIKRWLGNVPLPCGSAPSPTHLHTGFWLAPQTRALLLPSRPDPLATGCRKPFLTSPTHPFEPSPYDAGTVG